MTQRNALITNVLDFVGPPALQALVGDGFRVLAHDPSFDDASRRHEFETANPDVVAIPCDDPEEVIGYVTANADAIDVLVSNDTFPAIHSPIEDAAVDDLRATLDRLMIYPFRLLKAALPMLKAQGKGNVIMITSCRTDLPLPGGAIPDMARAGANAFVRSLSLELAPCGIPVNAIAPNYLYSEAYFPKSKFVDDPVGRQFIRDIVPAGRLGDPDEIGELLSYLANMEGSFQTGTIIRFAGGWPAAPARPV